MANQWDDEQMRAIAEARGGKLLRVKRLGKKQTPFLYVECRYGHVFSLPVKTILNDGWCPICEKRERDQRKKQAKQQAFEMDRLYALTILAYEYPQWFHLGPPYLPAMRFLWKYLKKQLGEKYPELTDEMYQSAIQFIEAQPGHEACLLQPGPRYLPDGTEDVGKPITEAMAEKNRKKYLQTSDPSQDVIVYTDGGCPMSVDPWCGTWAYAIYDGSLEKLLASASGTVYPLDRKQGPDTVPFAELTAAIMALSWCRLHAEGKILIRADSLFVTDRKTNPAAKQRTSISRDLREAGALYWSEVKSFGNRLTLQKVKGHSKLWENELVDAMCRREYARKYRRGSVAVKELAAARRLPWLERQIEGVKLKIYRHATRKFMAALQRYALDIGRKLIAFGHRQPKRKRKKRGTRFS